jgi:hypothetical protein
MPAEKLESLKELVVPQKIRRPKDVLPVMANRFSELRQRRPKTLYAVLVCFALTAGISLYKSNRVANTKIPEVVVKQKPQPANVSPVPPTAYIAPAPKAKTAPAKPVATETKKAAPAAPVKEDRAKEARLRWNKLITATNSNYGVGLLGGIKGLEVTVTNNSDYLVDEAVAKLTYIKANGEVWKTVFVSTYGVHPHESKTQPVADVGRSKKVKASLYKVVSKKMKLSYTEGQKIKNYGDPYYAD